MSTSETGSFLGSNAPWPPATMTVRERSSPRSVLRTTRSSSQAISWAVVSRCTGTSNWPRACSRNSATRSLASTRRWPGTSKIHFSGYSVVSWPPSSGSESMMREDASRMPAQNAVERPTGPAPMMVMSRTSPKSGCEVMGEGEGGGEGSAVEGRECPLDGGRNAGEGRGVALRVGGRLRGAQPLHQVEEGGGLVRLERDDELLVVEPEGVARVEVDLGVLAADPDVLLHHPVALLGRQPVPLARLDEGIDEEVLAVARAHLQA